MRKNKEQWKPVEVYYDAASHVYFTKDGRRSSGTFEICDRNPEPGDDYIPELCMTSSPIVVNIESRPAPASCYTFGDQENYCQTFQHGLTIIEHTGEEAPYFGTCTHCGGTRVKDKYGIRCTYCETRYEK